MTVMNLITLLINSLTIAVLGFVFHFRQVTRRIQGELDSRALNVLRLVCWIGGGVMAIGAIVLFIVLN